MALMIQADLNTIGLDVRLEPMTPMAAIERLVRGSYDGFLAGWYAGNFDPAEIVNYWFNPDLVESDTNMAKYYNPEVGALLDRSLGIFDTIERGRVIREALGGSALREP